jgi:3-oxosteroid 1-dehydrogenase
MNQYDLVIIGSGAGGLAAALAAKAAGIEPVVLEKTDKIGGNTALSGGVIWVPNNPLMAREGDPDSSEEALTYLNAAVGEPGGSSTVERRRAFVLEGPPMIELLEKLGIRFQRQHGRPDYYDELPGGNKAGRSLECPLFDLRDLGPWKDKIRLGFRRLPIEGREARHMFLGARTLRGLIISAKVASRMAWGKLTGAERVGVGGAVVGRMLKACLEQKIDLRTDAGVRDLIVENSRVVGVQLMSGGEMRARRGVLIAAGGFARNADMLDEFQPRPTSVKWTMAGPGETGEMIGAAINAGAAARQMDQQIGLICTTLPGDSLTFMLMEISKPYCMLVDRSGRRYLNEAGSYMESAQQMYERNESVPAIPSWMIMDARHRRYYPFGMTPPGYIPDAWKTSGYIKIAPSIAELASMCEIDAAALQETVRRYNGFARTGVDEDFHKGARQYDRYFGDPRVKPNPTMGGIEQGPFMAVPVHPGNVGTFGGLLTDEYARVIREDGSPIAGLYATGTSTASILRTKYVGAGASVSCSAVFGYVAARHCASVEKDRGGRGAADKIESRSIAG